MSLPPKAVVLGFLSLAAVTVAVIAAHLVIHRVDSNNPDFLLLQADEMAWNNRWVEAEPLYRRAETLFLQRGEPSKALYARVSEIPPNAEASSLPTTILTLTEDLERPEASDPETRLRILVILGMIEVNYDATLAHQTWLQVEQLARQRHRYLLAARAVGEQGISAFILGDISTAKNQVITAWGLAKVLHDPAARVRYASVYGAGLVELHRYKEALNPLNEAISTASSNREIGYPNIAVSAKVDALRGLHEYNDALTLANDALKHIPNPSLKGHEIQILTTRAEVYEDLGQWPKAIADCKHALNLARNLQFWRGITQVGGFLALAYEHQGDLQNALDAVNQAIQANTHIPDELYFVPKNVAIKAEIVGKLGRVQESDELYRKSETLIDVMLAHAPTRNVERLLLTEMSEVYSGYFASLCAQKDYDQAFRTLEQARGRVETEALQHRETIPPHAPTPDESRLTKLNLALIDSDDPRTRAEITDAIYHTEITIDSTSLEGKTATNPVNLHKLQKGLTDSELLIEYVLAEPNSQALAITKTTVHPYTLGSQAVLEADATQYRDVLRKQTVDLPLGQRVFDELLKPIGEYQTKKNVVLVADGSLHLLPFAALVDHGQYILRDHIISVVPSATVFDILSDRGLSQVMSSLPYVGVAAWAQSADHRNFIVRAVTGPERSQLEPLPDSKREVESIGADLPKPSTILLGSDATETHFKQLPLSQYNVLHLALHGYADLDYPDRSALVFAPQSHGTDDGLLQVREIRNLHLNAKLVTLSACDTGVGPVGEAGVANLVNAFIEAGADSVVSTLWDLEDHSTSRLMTTFYDHLAHHETEADALRDAQLSLLNENAPPYFWASFELVGNPNISL